MTVMTVTCHPRHCHSDIATNKAIHQLGLAKDWQGAVWTLSIMTSKSKQPDVFSLSAAMTCHWRKAMLLLRGNVVQSQVSFNAASGACIRDNAWHVAESLFAELGKVLLEASAITFSLAIGASARDWLQAFRVLHDMSSRSLQPNQIIMGKAVAACQVYALWRRALGLLEETSALQIKINQIIRSTAISVVEKASSWSQAFSLFDRQASDVISFSAAIRAGNSVSQWCFGAGSLQLMQQKLFKPNVVSYGAAITACEKSCHWSIALSILWGMESMKTDLNTVSCNGAISACEKSEKWQLALALLEIMCAKKLADTTSFNAAMSAAEKAHEWRIALALLAHFVRIVPDTISYNAAISACEKSSEWKISLELLSQLCSRLRPSEVSFSAAISACEKGGQWPFALFLLNRMPEVHLVPNGFSYSAVVSGGSWRQGVSLLHQMHGNEVEAGGEFLVCLARACEETSLSARSLVDLERWTKVLK